ncbi:cation-translocating P-type ATPase [Pararhizobium antarcticum]|uniref:Nitrogen fixation protein FixI n=1 Tax=Pararhizobium antarcticum TaxID=1798805 RepID=A0A657LUW4_9HYPH|nr:cation-translocating P-type ATPase [Pararhizobium antarcticum]OJF92756.1 nitrogen fixation protein FixI [Rhizobium sp. 58]OJF95118.1 nitrogen fixation protein FixI [Pararhizobium antarcticum]
MSCCGTSAGLAIDIEAAKTAGPSADEILFAAKTLGDGTLQTDLSIPSMHCAACMRAIETGLSSLPNVISARVNLSTKRVTVKWTGNEAPAFLSRLQSLGYPAHLTDEFVSGKDKTLSELLLAVGIAGFATGNIMLLSVSVWSGAEGATRDLFHWVSALIAIPVIVFAGRIYFRSAWNALRHGRMNMDVPIAIGVSLAYATSLYETITHGEHAYFDASVSLLFFLLIGRTLDHVMRDKARAAVSGLVRLSPRGAVRIGKDGNRDYLPLGEIEPGMHLAIAAGDRIPVNATVIDGVSELDCSLATGESVTRAISPGSDILAGTHNLSGPLVIRATAAARDSFLAEMVGLMEAAEQGRGTYRRLADRASAMYSPVVHITALATFIGWMILTGDWHHAITVATAVLIITCPCALGLAVPIVQVVAARRLFENGVMMKDGGALERLAEIDTVVFDKTGTLTTGSPVLQSQSTLDDTQMRIAVALARSSKHPFSRAIAKAHSHIPDTVRLEDVKEYPGLGVEARSGGHAWRLGRASWAMAPFVPNRTTNGTVLSRDGVLLLSYDFLDILRPDAVAATGALREAGMQLEILSGDRKSAVAHVASMLSIPAFSAGVLPVDKVDRLHHLKASGARALMVGDGINDAPAMMAAHVSMAPASAADIGRSAADFIFLRDSLKAVPLSLKVAKHAERLVKQNFALAIGYNLIAVPIAVMGHVTPLIAAIAMSGSSLLVIGNAMRLTAGEGWWTRRLASLAWTRRKVVDA